jgi:hypothetical protein
MNNSKTPKIVVGVGLAAVYATVMAAFMPRGADDNVVAQNASVAVPTQVAPELVPPAVIDPVSANTSASVAEQSAATTTAATPVASIPAKNVNAPPPSRESEGKSQVTEQPVARVATVSSPNAVEIAEPIPSSEGNSAGRSSLITPEVTSQVAAAAPDVTSEVTTTSAVVESTGSVSTEE